MKTNWILLGVIGGIAAYFGIAALMNQPTQEQRPTKYKKDFADMPSDPEPTFRKDFDLTSILVPNDPNSKFAQSIEPGSKFVPNPSRPLRREYAQTTEQKGVLL